MVSRAAICSLTGSIPGRVSVRVDGRARPSPTPNNQAFDQWDPRRTTRDDTFLARTHERLGHVGAPETGGCRRRGGNLEMPFLAVRLGGLLDVLYFDPTAFLPPRVFQCMLDDHCLRPYIAKLLPSEISDLDMTGKKNRAND